MKTNAEKAFYIADKCLQKIKEPNVDDSLILSYIIEAMEAYAKEYHENEMKKPRMFVYSVGYYSYEESPRYLLQSEKEYNQNQFDELLSDCFARAYKENIKTESVEDDDGLLDSVEYLLRDVIKILKNDFGFIDFKPQAIFIPFGWASTKDSSNWKRSEDNQLKLIRMKVNLLLNKKD